MAVFGKKGLPSARTPVGPPPISVLENSLGGRERVIDEVLTSGSPQAHMKVAAAGLFDAVYHSIKSPRGARIEDLLGVLASVGGHACTLGALDIHFKNGGISAENDLKIFAGKKGTGSFYFGDLPNRLLLESPESLLSLALGAAQARGGTVSIDKVHDVMRHVVQTIGTPCFAVPRIKPPNQPYDLPVNYIIEFAPALLKVLREYRVPMNKSATAFGFAIYKVITQLNSDLNPTVAADIVTECAVPSAKFDPMRFAHFKEVMTP